MPSGAEGKRRTKWRRAQLRAHNKARAREQAALDGKVVKAATDAASATGELIEERRPLVEWERRAGRLAWVALAAVVLVVIMWGVL